MKHTSAVVLSLINLLSEKVKCKIKGHRVLLFTIDTLVSRNELVIVR